MTNATRVQKFSAFSYHKIISLSIPLKLNFNKRFPISCQLHPFEGSLRKKKKRYNPVYTA